MHATVGGGGDDEEQLYRVAGVVLGVVLCVCALVPIVGPLLCSSSEKKGGHAQHALISTSV